MIAALRWLGAQLDCQKHIEHVDWICYVKGADPVQQIRSGLVCMTTALVNFDSMLLTQAHCIAVVPYLGWRCFVGLVQLIRAWPLLLFSIAVSTCHVTHCNRGLGSF